jgi:hypothetical protein
LVIVYCGVEQGNPMSIFRHQQVVAAEGPAVDSPLVKAKVREAYDRGRSEERRRHHGSPMLTLLLVLVAAVGAVTLYYSFRQGSFMGGGAAIDTRIAQVDSTALPAIQTAAQKAGTIAQTAGQKLQSQGQAIKQDAASDNPPANGSTGN